MEQITQYQVINKISQLSQNIQLWFCENAHGERFDILTIEDNHQTKRLIERLLLNEVKPLINKEISGFQKVIETGFDTVNNATYIVYEANDGEILSEQIADASINSVKAIAKGLDILKKENRQNLIIEPENIIINSNGEAKVRYNGLFELFKSEGLLNHNYLSPNVIEWLTDNRKTRPNFQDDIYSLVKSFKDYFSSTYETDNPEVNDLFNKSLCEKRMERSSKYHEFLLLLERIPLVKKGTYTDIRQTVRVKTQQQHEGEFQEIVNSMNVNAWFLIESKRSNEKNQITGQFSTNEWSGRFFVDNGGYMFIPFGGCQNKVNEKIIKNGNSFLSEFSFSLISSNFNCLPFFEANFQQQNRLAELNKSKTESVKLWQTLPDKEREFIEERAFKARYNSRELIQNSSNIKFHITEVAKENWVRLKELKNEQVILFIDDQKIGKILDFNPKDGFVVIKDPICILDEISEKGELSEDIRQETSQYKKQVEACNRFENSDIVNPLLCGILATPESTLMPTSSYVQDWQYDNFKHDVFNSELKNDDTQREAVLEALHHKPIYLIQGPPGTGKSTVIVELIRQMIKRQRDVKILVTSQSNLAVDNVLDKLDKINQIEDAGLHFMRLASDNTIENENIIPTVLPHTFENKLKNWVTETELKAKTHFSEHYPTQLKQNALIEFYEFYSLLDREKGLTDFNFRLRMSPNYIKRLFADVKNLKDVTLIFEQELGKDFLKMKDLQRDWFAFLGGVTVEDGKDRKKSMLNNGSNEIDFLTAMMMQTNIIGSTCIHIASGKYSKVNFRFDYVIMDESSKASPAETLVPLNMGQNIILIGDHKQLPPVVTREEAVKQKVIAELEDNGLDFEKGFSESLFEKLVKSFEGDESKRNYIKMLDVQYRMPRQVGSLISKYFYDSKLKNPNSKVIPDYDQQKHHELNLKKDTSIIFLSTSRKKDPNDNDNKFNRQNRCNVEAIKEILARLDTLYGENLKKTDPFTIGIIAGYRGQVDLLKSSIDLSLYSSFVKTETNEGSKQKKVNLIEINTVDKFQGAQRDIMIYDVVRSSKGQSNIGFLDDYRRINVAFSRVKRLLFIVGDADYLIKRATLNPNGKFTEFKLQQIATELQQQGLIFEALNEILQ